MKGFFISNELMFKTKPGLHKAENDIFELIFIKVNISKTQTLIIDCVNCAQTTHFVLPISFYTPWKNRKSRSILMFLGGIKKNQYHEMESWKQKMYINMKFQ